MAEHSPYPLNAPGDFYVVDGCCTMCEVPFVEAPELFDHTRDPRGYSHCFVRRQPETAGEVDRMLKTMRAAELQCIRYRGKDPLIQLRLIQLGEGDQCDHPPAESAS